MPTRRDFVKLGLGTAAWLAGLGCKGKKPDDAPLPPPPKVEAKRPRYWVLVLLSGGHDTLFTTDPKLQKDVDDIVTLPQDNKIVTAGELSFGPHFGPLARWSKDLTILNGVAVRTVNHETGQKQFCHLKTNIVESMPSALDVIATRRSGQPLGTAYINLSSRIMHSPAFIGTADQFFLGRGDIFEQVSKASPDELATLSKVMRKQADDLGPKTRGWREAEQTAVYLREVASFFDKAGKVPALVPEERSTDYTLQSMAESLERAVWLMEHDLCCGIVLDLGLLSWDTHLRNESKQAEMNGHFAQFFDDYLTALREKKNEHGTLADQTMTIVGSELGRFPHQNDMLGKDHLPQTSFLLSGPGIKPGKSFGRTGRRMEGLPISYKNGDHVDAGRVPLLDDLGTTLLHLAGIDPERYGYTGKVCEFLLDGTA